MSFETDLLSGLGIWILALSPLGFMITTLAMAQMISKGQPRPSVESISTSSAAVSLEGKGVGAALEDALRLNSVSARVSSSPISYLQGSAKYAPRKFRSAVVEITAMLRGGQIVCLDLAHLESVDAARLIDFCSGTIAISGGWIYHPAGMVIILIPGRND